MRRTASLLRRTVLPTLVVGLPIYVLNKSRRRYSQHAFWSMNKHPALGEIEEWMRVQTTGSPLSGRPIPTLKDPSAFFALCVRLLGEASKKGEQDVFLTDTRLLGHLYVMIHDVTPRDDELSAIGVTKTRYEEVASSPKTFPFAFLATFPLGASLEYHDRQYPVVRLMAGSDRSGGEDLSRGDPISVQDYERQQFPQSTEEVRGTYKVVMDTHDLIGAMVGPATPLEKEGVVVDFFTALTLRDELRASHVLQGGVIQIKFYDFATGRFILAHVGYGSGSFMSGFPNTIAAYNTWTYQAVAMRRMLRDPRFYSLMRELDAMSGPEEANAYLSRLTSLYSPDSVTWQLLNRVVQPYRLFQKYWPGGPAIINNRYIIKEG